MTTQPQLVTIDVNGEQVSVPMPQATAAMRGDLQADLAAAAAASASAAASPAPSSGGGSGAGTPNGGKIKAAAAAGAGKSKKAASSVTVQNVTVLQVKSIIKVQALARRHAVLKLLATNLEKRRLITKELFDNESNYVKNLSVVLKYFERPLRAKLGQTDQLLTEAQIDLLFAEVSNLYDCHDMLLTEFSEKYNHWNRFKRISTSFETVSEAMQQCYQIYSSQYEDAIDFLRDFRSANPAFETFLKEAGAASGTRYDLGDLLILPIQRFPQYSLILERYRDALDQKTKVAGTPRSQHPDFLRMQMIIRRVKRVAENMNERRKETEKRVEVRVLERQLRGSPIKLVNSGRVVVKELTVAYINAQGDRCLRQLIVFNDAFLLVKVIRQTPQHPQAGGNLVREPSAGNMLNRTSTVSTNSNLDKRSSMHLPHHPSSAAILGASAAPQTAIVLQSQSTPPPQLELEWFHLLQDMTLYPMVDMVKGHNFSDPAVALDELSKFEKSFDSTIKMEEKAKQMKKLYAEEKKSTVAGWAQYEVGEMENDAVKYESLLLAARHVYNLNRAQVGVQIVINAGPDRGTSLTIAVNDVPTRDDLLKDFSILRVDSTKTALQRSQTVSQTANSKVLLWHVQSPSAATSNITSSIAASIAFVQKAVLTRVSKLTFSLQTPNSTTQLTERTTSQRNLRAPSNKSRRAALSVRWTADVVSVTETSRSIVRLCLLNHALVCGYALQKEGISNTAGGNTPKKDSVKPAATQASVNEDDEDKFFTLEWLSPLLSLKVEPCDIPAEWKEAGSPQQADLARELREIQRQIDTENNMLSAAKRLASAHSLQRQKSEAMLTVQKNEQEILANIDRLKKSMEPIQRLLSLSSARVGVKVEVKGSGLEYFVAFEAANVRDNFMERLVSVQNASSKRISKALFRAAKKFVAEDDSDSSSQNEDGRMSQDAATPIQKKRVPLEKTFSNVEMDLPEINENDPALLAMHDEVQKLLEHYLVGFGKQSYDALEKYLQAYSTNSLTGQFKSTGVYISKQDHLAETEEDLMFLRGERVYVLKTLDDCCLCGCEGVVGTVHPRCLLNLADAGIQAVPDLNPAGPNVTLHMAKADYKKDSVDTLAFFGGDEIAVIVKNLPAPYHALGYCAATSSYGWVNPQLLGPALKRK